MANFSSQRGGGSSGFVDPEKQLFDEAQEAHAQERYADAVAMMNKLLVRPSTEGRREVYLRE